MNATSPNAHPPSILPPSDDADRRQSNVTLPDAGYRRRVATVLLKVNKLFETPASSSFDDSQFTHGPAVEFPELPGEENRNPNFIRIRNQYNQNREAENASDSFLSRRHSRASSYAGSVNSGVSGDPVNPGGERARGISPVPRALRSTSPSPDRPGDSRATESSARRDTLEVPRPTHHPMRTKRSASSPTTMTDTAEARVALGTMVSTSHASTSSQKSNAHEASSIP